MVQPRVTPWRVGPMSTGTVFIDMMSPARSTWSPSGASTGDQSSAHVWA